MKTPPPNKEAETLEEIAERVIGVRRQPRCAICQTKMIYAPGAPEAHVPPHWFCRSDGGALPDSDDFATDEQEQSIEDVLSCLRNERERAAKIADACENKWLEDARNVARADDLVGGLAQSTYTMYAEIAHGIAATIREGK